jgi:hypothetical protein
VAGLCSLFNVHASIWGAQNSNLCDDVAKMHPLSVLVAGFDDAWESYTANLPFIQIIFTANIIHAIRIKDSPLMTFYAGHQDTEYGFLHPQKPRYFN